MTATTEPVAKDNGRATADSTAPANPRAIIAERSRRKVRGYERSRDDWNQARSLKRVLEQTKREYSDRFLYELIQNGYDAHPRGTSDGEICVLLDAGEGSHGVLYVANRGRPFDNDNFEAICELAQSDKDPQESIGNKGVGFKSVLRVCEWPEIFSARADDGMAERFDGYCFSFARPSDMLSIVDGDEQRAQRVVEDVSPYFLPVPLVDQPERVVSFAREGMATVIRMPLRSADALEVATDRLARLAGDRVPVHLFLERVALLRLVRIDSDGVSSETRLTRDAIAIDALVVRDDQAYELVNLEEQGEWFIARRTIAGPAVREQILASIENEQIDPAWAVWDSDATVGVAVRLDGRELEPRLYTYLPMEEEASAPLHGHVHAPFSTKLARTAVDLGVPYNELLINTAAEAAALAVLDFCDHEDVVSPTALVDLLAWDGHHERIALAFRESGTELASARIVPIVPLDDGRARGSLTGAFAWRQDDLTFITRDRLASFARAEIVVETIDEERLERLDDFCLTAIDEFLEPDGDVRAEWLERIAAEMHVRQHQPGTWDRYYDDLASVMQDDAESLRGRRFLLGGDDALHAPPERSDGDDSDDQVRPLVFFPPARDRTDSDEDVESTADIAVPRSLSSTLVEMHEGLRWNRQEGSRRVHTRARRFLEDSRLVRGYKTADLLDHIGRVLSKSRGGVTKATDALRFAFQLQRAARSVRAQDIASARLRVPVEGGWIAAQDALFGSGWDTPLASPLSELVDSSAALSGDLEALRQRRILPPSAWPFRIDDVEAWRAFLEQAGVRDGLWPVPGTGDLELLGRELWYPEGLAARFGLADDEAKAWAARVRQESDWAPAHERTPYRPRHELGVLPGQREYDRLNHRAKLAFARLVIAGLGAWGSTALQIEWHRFKHPSQPDRRAWPSPLAVFLETTAWMAVRDPLDPRTEVFTRPGDAWHFGETRGEEPPTFSPLVTAEHRRAIDVTSGALVRLKSLGLNHWQDEGNVPALLSHLASLVEQERAADGAVHGVRGACSDAWRRLCSAGEPPVPVPSRLVVARGGVLGVWSQDLAEPVFVGSKESPLAHGLIEASGAALLVAEVEDGDRIAASLEPSLGSQVRRLQSVDVVLLADEHPIEPSKSAGSSLVHDLYPWLRAVVALVLETRRTRFDRTGAQRRRETIEQLERVRVQRVGVLDVLIDGQAVPIPTRLRGILPLPDRQAPTLVIPGEQELLAPSDMSQALCELLRVGNADALQNVLLKLERDGVAEPTVSDLARALEISVERVVEIQAHLDSSVSELAGLLAPAVVVLGSPESGQAIWDRRDGFSQEEELREAIAIAVPDRDAHQIIATAKRAPLLSSLRDGLHLDFGAFNDALRLLGRGPIQNPVEHEQATRHFVTLHREDLLLELRRRWVSPYRAREPLSTYVNARTLAGIAPDPAWLDRYDAPPDSAVSERARQWIETLGGKDPPPDVTLDPVDDLRQRNRSTVSERTPRASSLIRGWARKNAAPLDEVWSAGDACSSILDRANAEGLLDFDGLDESGVIDLLDRLSLLPAGMPYSLDPAVLDLSEAELELDNDDADRNKQERDRQSRILTIDGKELSAEEESFADLFQEITSNLSEALLGRSTRATTLSPFSLQRGHSPSRPPSRRPGGRNLRRQERPSRVQLAAIGLAGETVVHSWLERHYSDVFTPECWRSSYCAVLGIPDGDDTLGYDFEIVLRTKTIYFEVKATTGDDPQFELGESEVSRARDCAGRSTRDYRVLYISHVLDGQRRSLDVLPNPMDPANRDLYRFPGSGLRCVFEPT